MSNIIKLPEIAKKEPVDSNNIKEEEQMKKCKIIRFSEIKKDLLRNGSAVLMVAATFFASATCLSHFYEPQVPQKLLKSKDQ